MPDDRTSFITQWHVHLKRRAIAQGYGFRELIPAPNPIVDNLLPPLLFLQTMELFDQGQQIVLSGRPEVAPGRRTLGGRAHALIEATLLQNGSRVLEFVNTRNEVAHELKLVSWETLDHVIVGVHAELVHLGFQLGEIPNYKVAFTKQRITCPHCKIHICAVVRLLQDDQPVEVVARWEERVGGVPHRVRVEGDELVAELLTDGGHVVSVIRWPSPASIQA